MRENTYFASWLLGSSSVGVDLTQRIPSIRRLFRLPRIASTQCHRLRVLILILIQNPKIRPSRRSRPRRRSSPAPHHTHRLTTISLHLNPLHSTTNDSSSHLSTTSIVTLISSRNRNHLPRPIPTPTPTRTRTRTAIRIRVW
ncbi:hypothetical protein HanRHA438_Chr14g0656031 [Helianthus annuus]|nr:hypothetical protein HanRHA438_Chr14g0656031 [Helianthus annuus]